MSLRPILLVPVVAAALGASPLVAGVDAVRLESFRVLHGLPEQVRAPDPGTPPAVEGLEVSLADGILMLKAAVVRPDPKATLEAITVTTKVPMDGSLFTAPVRTLVGAFLADATLTAGRVVLDGAPDLKGLTLRLEAGGFELTGKAVGTLRARGKVALPAEGMALAAELESVKLGPLPMPMKAVFAALERFAKLPGLRLERPFLYFDLEPLLR